MCGPGVRWSPYRLDAQWASDSLQFQVDTRQVVHGSISTILKRKDIFKCQICFPMQTLVPIQ